MRDNQRVFVTGRSALTASGLTADATWSALMAGQTSIAPLKHWELPGWPTQFVGELPAYQPAALLPDRKLLKVISRQDVLGINAAMQAIEHSQLLDYRAKLVDTEQFNDETAVFVGSPGNKYFQQYDFLPLLAKSGGEMPAFAEQLFNEVHPMWLLRILPNNVLAYTGITYGFKGVNHNITNHAVGGTQALLEAYHTIASGQAARAIVVAYDIGFEPQALFYYDKLGVLSDAHLRPFDASHNGTLLAEGAAAIVLENEESAKARGAKCYAEILGGRASSEAAGLFSLEADGENLANLITHSLADSGLNTHDVSLAIAHGNGNPKSDISEAHAIERVFGSEQPPVSAFKWAMGHTLCASGLIDAVLTTYALENQCIPGVANLTEVAANCHGLNVAAQTRSLQAASSHALLINRGFASMNACVIMKSCVSH